jgi:hypothetical protein
LLSFWLVCFVRSGARACARVRAHTFVRLSCMNVSVVRVGVRSRSTMRCIAQFRVHHVATLHGAQPAGARGITTLGCSRSRAEPDRM